MADQTAGADGTPAGASLGQGVSAVETVTRVDVPHGAVVQVGDGNSQYNSFGVVYVQAGVVLPAQMPPSVGPAVPAWAVDRPEEAGEVAAALLNSDGETVGPTIELNGAGGFGKTTLAKMVCADVTVRQRFPGGTYWVTVGRDARGPEIAAKVNDLLRQLTGQDAAFSDPEQAGQRLGALLESGPRRLLVLDDVWEAGQLAPFTAGGRRCTRLVTTRNPRLLDGRAARVQVDEMSSQQARQLLSSGLPGLSWRICEELLAVTGRWPLLLQLANGILRNAAQAGQDTDLAGTQLLGRLLEGGPAAVDDVSGPAGRLDVGEPGERARAVRATVGASTSLLGRHDADRFAELSIFAGDEPVPFSDAARLWRATTGLDELLSGQLLARLATLGLVFLSGEAPRGVVLHDVIRDFLRSELGPRRLEELNVVFLDFLASCLPAGDLSGARVHGPAQARWWELDPADDYMREHLIGHLLDAGCYQDAEDLACDLRWVGERVRVSGPAAAAVDLARVNSPRAVRLQAVLARTAHLLGPAEPSRAVVDVLHSRVSTDPDWGPQAAALRDECPRPRLVDRWPPPDLPNPALRTVLASGYDWADCLVIAPGGRWAAACSKDGTVRIWDVATGEARPASPDGGGAVRAAAVTPDGTQLVTAGADGGIRVWDAGVIRSRDAFACGAPLKAVSVTADGGGLAAVCADGTVQIRDAADGRLRAVYPGCSGSQAAHADKVAVTADGTCLVSALFTWVQVWDAQAGQACLGFETYVESAGDDPPLQFKAADGKTHRGYRGGRYYRVSAVAVAPDGSWLATGGTDGEVRTWDAATGQVRAFFAAHDGSVTALGVAPDGKWLATTGDDRLIRVWDVAALHAQGNPGVPRRPASALAAAPDGNWVATYGDKKVQVWNAATRQARTILANPRDQVGLDPVLMAVAPDGSWLATAGDSSGSVQLWDTATWQSRTVIVGVAATAMTPAPDGTWLATASGWEGTITLWDTATWQNQVTLVGQNARITDMAAAPDGSWLAAAGDDDGRRDILIWDIAERQPRASLYGTYHGRVTAMAVARDGSWLATASNDLLMRVIIWDPSTGQPLGVIPRSAPTWALAVAPAGNWLAIAGQDQTVLVCDTATWTAQALIRVENKIHACAWLGTKGLAAATQVGLHLYDFLTGTTPPPPAPGR
jgi:WD40 repeat protein